VANSITRTDCGSITALVNIVTARCVATRIAGCAFAFISAGDIFAAGAWLVAIVESLGALVGVKAGKSISVEPGSTFAFVGTNLNTFYNRSDL